MMEKPFFLKLRGSFASSVLDDIREFDHDGSSAVLDHCRGQHGSCKDLLVDATTWSAISYVLVCLSLLDDPGQDPEYRAHAKYAKSALGRCARAGWNADRQGK